MRSREESSSSGHDDDQQPQPPPLMGGDGSHGVGVVASTEQPPCREENVEDETVTLQLQNPSSNDDNPILCSIVCNRRAIRASSTLIRNLLDNMGRDDQVLPPFSTEHIADELTLRRVVAFVTDVEPSLRRDHFSKECFTDESLYDVNEFDGEELLGFRLPFPSEISAELQEFYRDIVQKDGHRGGILNVLIAAHYLCCGEKLKNAMATHLATVIDAWISADSVFPRVFTDSTLFGKPNRFGNNKDPLANVPLPVLADIVKFRTCDVTFAQDVLKFSPTLFKSFALVEMIWKDCGRHNNLHNLSDPDCHICLAFEHRLEAHPDDESLCNALLWHPEQLKNLHPRWAKLVESLIAISAKQLVSQKTHLSRRFLSRVDLSLPTSLEISILAIVAQLHPTAMIHLPPLPPGGVDAIADCWKDFYHFATHEAPAVSLEMVPHDENSEDKGHLDVEQMAHLLLHNANLSTLHIRHGTKGGYGGLLEHESIVLSKLLETSHIHNMIIEMPSIFLNRLPSSLKRLEVRGPCRVSQVLDDVYDPDGLVLVEELVLQWERCDVAAVRSFTRFQHMYATRKKTLRVYLPPGTPKDLLLMRSEITKCRPTSSSFWNLKKVNTSSSPQTLRLPLQRKRITM